MKSALPKRWGVFSFQCYYAGMKRYFRWNLLAIVFSLVTCVGVVPFALAQESPALVKSPERSDVYYVYSGKRYSFPNERVYFSWQANFDAVRVISPAQLAAYPLAGNVTYRPGTRLVKIVSDPKVYAVEGGGVLRWISDEGVARQLYTASWNRLVDDVSDALFTDYRLGTPISTETDHDPIRVQWGNRLFVPPPARVRDPEVSSGGPVFPVRMDRPLTSASGKRLRVDLIVDTDTALQDRAFFDEYIRRANNLLVYRSDVELEVRLFMQASFRDLQSRFCPDCSTNHGRIASEYYRVTETAPPDAVILFREDEISGTNGGYSNVFPVADPAFCQRFPSPHQATSSLLYVGVVNPNHRYLACGYGGGKERIGVVSVGGECANQAGTACIVRPGYTYAQCDTPALLNSIYGRDPYAFSAFTLVHELLHPFGASGAQDHYGAAACPGLSRENGASEEYADLCPSVYRTLSGAYRSCS